MEFWFWSRKLQSRTTGFKLGSGIKWGKDSRKSEFFVRQSSVQNITTPFTRGDILTFHSTSPCHPWSALGHNNVSLSVSGQRIFEGASLEDSLCWVWARDLHVPHRKNTGAGVEGHPREHAGGALAAAVRYDRAWAGGPGPGVCRTSALPFRLPSCIWALSNMQPSSSALNCLSSLECWSPSVKTQNTYTSVQILKPPSLKSA